MEVAKLLDFAGNIFLTDNEMIANTMVKRNFKAEPGHWCLRPLLSQIQAAIPENLLQQVRWIPREVNRLADKFAKDVLIQLMFVIIYCI